MNRTLLFLAFLILSLSANGQRVIRFRDDYNNNENNWSEGSNEKTFTKVVYGHYELHHKRSSGGYTFYRDFFMDAKADFYFESRLMQTIGPENHGYGLLWGGKGGNDCYNFLISSNGYFTVGKWKGGKYTALKTWTKITGINPKFQYNIIAVKRKGGSLLFYVNGNEVHTMADQAFMGYKFGYNLKAAMKVKADYLALEYTSKEINLVKNARNGYVKENLGPLVNSTYIEKSPKISHDGKTLYYTRANHPNNVSEKDDAWYAEIQGDGNWGRARQMAKPINNQGHNFVVSITPDNNTLLVGNTYNADGSDKGSGVSITHRKGTGWELPKEVKIEDYYNDNKYVNFCLAPNRKILIMAVERKDSRGDQDLYFSELKADGTWTKPKNMGAVVNTFAKEFAPFVTADGRTMYFASQGHPGYGSADIFVTKRIGNSWTNWTKPENLGPEINTNLWDAYFTVPANGDYAYLVSKKNSIGKEDIFRIKLSDEKEEEFMVMDEMVEPSRKEIIDLTKPEEGAIEADPNEAEIVINTEKKVKDKPSFVPDPVVVIYGKIFDANTDQPLGATISYEDLNTKKELGIASSNPVTGDYKLVLPFGEHYGFVAEEKKHISASANIKVTGSGQYIEIEKNLYLVPLEVGKTVRVNNVFFVRSKPELLPKSYPELDRLVDLMKRHPNMSIELGGHTDGIGNPVLLMKLSNDRAKAVKQYLIEKGIASNRLSSKGYGRSRPIAPNNTEENRKRNRRVEFKITKL